LEKAIGSSPKFHPRKGDNYGNAPMEGLSYIIRTDDSGSGIDPKRKFAEFIEFCKNGKPDGSGSLNWIRKDGKKTGVITWLLGIPVYEAHFFATEPASTGTLLVITLTKDRRPMARHRWIYGLRSNSSSARGNRRCERPDQAHRNSRA